MAAMVSEDLEEDEENEMFQDTQEIMSQNTNTQSQNSQVSSNQKQKSNEVQNNNGSTIQVCRFYKQGNCKFGKDCRNDHPKFSKKITKHGILKYSPQGCNEKCGKLYPSACRETLRTKECLREKCMFYHIKGTNVGVWEWGGGCFALTPPPL
jgi:hypothetical protein